MYEIVMPQLSDSMEEGKLIEWKVQPGQKVKAGDVIANVESDKAVMEVQTFKAGTVASLKVEAGSTAPVGTVIAKIDPGEESNSKIAKRREQGAKKKDNVVSKAEPADTKVQKTTQTSAPTKSVQEKETKTDSSTLYSLPATRLFSPKARAKAAAYGLDAETIRQHTGKETIHVEDVETYRVEHYFTPKAQALLSRYRIDPGLFTLDHKIDSEEVEAYIAAHALALPTPLSPMQQAIIANVNASAKKPVYHVYESLDASLLQRYEAHYSMTAVLVRVFAVAMMRFAHFRARLHDDVMLVSPDANIAVAVADEEVLYMPVIRQAQRLSLLQISDVLASFKEKRIKRSFTAADFEGSTFGISNLGMFGVTRFDAMINKNDSAIAAIGAAEQGKLSVTLTIDHRLVNGYEAAQFVAFLKESVTDPETFKE